MGCVLVEACVVYNKRGYHLPWLGVVYASDIVRLVSFAPCLKKREMESAMFYVYNPLLERSALSFKCLEAVDRHFSLR